MSKTFQVTESDGEQYTWECPTFTYLAKKLLRKFMEDREYPYTTVGKGSLLIDISESFGLTIEETPSAIAEGLIHNVTILKTARLLPLSKRDINQMCYVITKGLQNV